MATLRPVTDGVLKGWDRRLSVHVPHRRHDILRRKFVVSEASVPHELALRRKSGEDHAAQVAVPL